MKACYSCKEKPVKNGIYKAHIETFIQERLPKTDKNYHKKGSPLKEIHGLKPNRTIFYFGAQKRLLTSPLKKFEDAYGNLPNSGVTHTDSKGNAKIFLECPQIYISLNGNAYNRHLHFIYWDDKKKEWSSDLFTQPLICHVDNEFVEKHYKKCIVIDALPEDYYNKRHIKGAFNLPYNKNISENDIKNIVKEKKMKPSNKQVPIIVYCYNKKCDASEKLIKKLNKLGYYNIVKYTNGIRGWKGESEYSQK